VRASKEELRLLLVDGASLTPDERVKLWPREVEVRDWYVQASDNGVGLVVLRTSTTIELYSTRQDGQLACSPPLLTLAQRGQSSPELSQVRVVPHRGMDAARHLFSLVAGIGMTRGKARVVLARVDTACGLATKAGCLNPTMDSLFRTAIRVGTRVENETLEGRPKTTASLREMADICAARIVEEELMNWKTEQAKLFRSLSLSENLVRGRWAIPPCGHDSQFPNAEEAPSGTRIRAAAEIDEPNPHAIARLTGTNDRTR
jgi:glutamyl-tRNA reductase